MGCKSSKTNTTGPLGSDALRNTNKRTRRGPAKVFAKLDTFRVAKGEKVTDNLVRPFISSPEEGEKYEVIMSSNDKWASKDWGVQRPKAAKGPRTRHVDPVVEICLSGCTDDEDDSLGRRVPVNESVTYFELSQESDTCFSPVHDLLPRPSPRCRNLLEDPDITRIVHKKRSPDLSLEPEGLLPGSVIEMATTRRKREEAEALRAWMERMQAQERAKL